MIVVSNTSPLLNLAVIGRLDLLRALYGRIIVPEAVRSELAVAGTDKASAIEITMPEWIETRETTNRVGVTTLLGELGPGEAEAIVLAAEMKADLLLLDERKGRMAAERLGLRYVGLLGVLVEARHKGLIDAIRPIMDELVRAGFWMSPQLYAHVLRVAGE